MIDTSTEAPHAAVEYGRAASLFRARRYDAALEAYGSLAKKGNAQAQEFLGWMYARGLGTAADSAKALLWLEKAASQGAVQSMFLAGRVLSDEGRHAEALTHYRAAGSKDYAPALYRLGVMHKRGHGVALDRPMARSYLSRAASKGNLFARRELAIDDITNGTPSQKLVGLASFAKLLPQFIRARLRNPYSDDLKG